MTCRACGENGSGQLHQLPESMYGTGELFDYTECPYCGSLQIAQIPPDLSAYYPPDYYSQAARTEPNQHHGLKRFLYEFTCESLSLSRVSFFRRVIGALMPTPSDFIEVGDYLATTKFLHRNEQILDVGCGASPYRLAAIKRCGFPQVTGVDPYVNSDTIYYGVPVKKLRIHEVTGVFALVMFHHSLEHVIDPLHDLTHAATLLRSGGLCVLRLPIKDGYMWRTFQQHWIELDAPRHLLIPSREGAGALANRAGFLIDRIEYDSEPWELEASRQHQAGVPLKQQLIYVPNSADNIAKRELDSAKVQQLNALADAGRARIYLRKP